MPANENRRRLLQIAGAALGTVVVSPLAGRAQAAEKDRIEEVAAVEDLMREHGVLRRALLVYAEAAARLVRGTSDVPAEALANSAMLFRSFGEDYHERRLEEEHVFPAVRKLGGVHASLIDTLALQHDRGREITDYIIAVAQRGHIASAETQLLANALASFVRMYEHHAAIEDTVVFSAWKKAISRSEYRELSEQFEEIEHRLFGRNGFDDAVAQITAIERAFDLSDLGKLTAPPPPAPAV
jgi:hemerythrin-like domain-containing protein